MFITWKNLENLKFLGDFFYLWKSDIFMEFYWILIGKFLKFYF